MRTRTTVAAAARAAAGCCSSGGEVEVWRHVAELRGPSVVVYDPEHGTWNTVVDEATARREADRMDRVE